MDKHMLHIKALLWFIAFCILINAYNVMDGSGDIRATFKTELNIMKNCLANKVKCKDEFKKLKELK